VDIPNRYTNDVVSYRQTGVAHGSGMADSQPGGLVAGGMADSTLPCHGRFRAAMPWQIPRRQELIADSTLPCHGRFPDGRSLWQIPRCHTTVDYWTQELMADPETGPWRTTEGRPMAGCLVVHT
jgi:hypothetical protein